MHILTWLDSLVLLALRTLGVETDDATFTLETPTSSSLHLFTGHGTWLIGLLGRLIFFLYQLHSALRLGTVFRLFHGEMHHTPGQVFHSSSIGKPALGLCIGLPDLCGEGIFLGHVLCIVCEL